MNHTWIMILFSMNIAIWRCFPMTWAASRGLTIAGGLQCTCSLVPPAKSYGDGSKPLYPNIKDDKWMRNGCLSTEIW